MRWSWHVGRILGIDVRIHWTFFLLLAWIGAAYLTQGQGVPAALFGIVTILSVFACVLLHEFGHALAARRYGIDTVDITLLPIGGVARLKEMPQRPSEELVVALAGPAVNVVIAAALFVVLALLGATGNFSLAPVDDAQDVAKVSAAGFLSNLLWINVFLVVFNMLPAFPMDGGRVLRALLAMNMDRARATEVAASVGQMMAILFGFAGLMWNPLLLLIAIFVYLGAGAEAEMVRVQSTLGDLPVSAGMMANYRILRQSDTLAQARDAILDGSQQDFPVLDGDRLAGMLYRQDLIQSLKTHGPDAPISKVMSTVAWGDDAGASSGSADGATGPERRVPAIAATGQLHGALQNMRERGLPTLPVVDGDRLVGIVSHENIAELIMLRDAELGYAAARPAAGELRPAGQWVDRKSKGAHL